MDDLLLRLLDDLAGRVTGPMKFRLLLQPAMAIFFAVKAGLRDARQAKPPYAWALFSDPTHRRDLIRDGWKDVGKIFALALVLDAVYQWIVGRFVYPGEAVLVAIVLAIIPYLFTRGLVTRLSRRKDARPSP